MQQTVCGVWGMLNGAVVLVCRQGQTCGQGQARAPATAKVTPGPAAARVTAIATAVSAPCTPAAAATSAAAAKDCCTGCGSDSCQDSCAHTLRVCVAAEPRAEAAAAADRAESGKKALI